MKKKCKICEHIGQVIQKNGVFACEICGSEIALTQEERHTLAVSHFQIDAECPYCKNIKGNYMLNGQHFCAGCGKLFDPDAVFKQILAGTFEEDIAPSDRADEDVIDLTAGLEKENRPKQSSLRFKGVLWAVLGVALLNSLWIVSVFCFYMTYRSFKRAAKC